MFARTTLYGLLLYATAPDASAEVPDSSDAARIRVAVTQGHALPLPRILDLARRRVPGEVLRIELEDSAGTLAYELRMLTPDGALRAIFLDARSGAILRIEAL
jgi:uncharacterized membrane protein YkoI